MFIYSDVNAYLYISHSACVNRIKLNCKCPNQVGKVLSYEHDVQEYSKKGRQKRNSSNGEEEKSLWSKQLPERQIVMICKMNKSWQKMRYMYRYRERMRTIDSCFSLSFTWNFDLCTVKSVRYTANLVVYIVVKFIFLIFRAHIYKVCIK